MVFRLAEPSDPDARVMLRRYLAEVAERYYGRAVAETELDDLEVEPFNADPYAQHWFSRDLG